MCYIRARDEESALRKARRAFRLPRTAFAVGLSRREEIAEFRAAGFAVEGGGR